MPKYEINTALRGIEIYFEKKPEEKILDELRKEGWRWHYRKQCWYTRTSTEALFFAESLCRETRPSETHQQKPSSAIPPVSQNETASISYNITSNGVVLANVKITKKGNNYTAQSTNNQLLCCDCKRMISIHAPACPFCGCPMSYITEHDFIETQRKNAMKAKHEEDLRRKSAEEERLAAERRRLEAEEAKRIERQKAREEKKRREMEEFLRKEKEAKLRADKIKEICEKYSVPKETVSRLISSPVSPEALEGRIGRILYYKRQYPYLNIGLSHFIASDTIDDYVLRNKWKEIPTTKCTGNCSTCTREYCVEER